MTTAIQKNTSTAKAKPAPAVKPTMTAGQKAAATKAAKAQAGAAATTATAKASASSKGKAIPAKAAKTAPAQTPPDVGGTVTRKAMAERIRLKVKESGAGAIPAPLIEEALKAFESVVAETLNVGGEINFPGFGKFKVRDVAERQGRNPKSGEEVTIAATKKVTFKVGAGLKKAVLGIEGDEGE